MKKTAIYASVFFFVVIVVIGIVEYNKYKTDGTGILGAILGPGNAKNYDAFAQCLTQKGFVMAGTEWCPHCKNQKARFGSSFKYVNYKDCEAESQWCSLNGIDGYPTWVLPNGTKEGGEKELYELAQISACALP